MYCANKNAVLKSQLRSRFMHRVRPQVHERGGTDMSSKRNRHLALRKSMAGLLSMAMVVTMITPASKTVYASALEDETVHRLSRNRKRKLPKLHLQKKLLRKKRSRMKSLTRP